MSEQPEFIQRVTGVGAVSVVLYSLDGDHWDSSKKLLLQWQRTRVKELHDFKKSWRRGTPKKVIG